MIVSDLFRIMSENQDVDIYSLKDGVYIFTGESRDITISCMALEVKRVFPINDLLVITVE